MNTSIKAYKAYRIIKACTEKEAEAFKEWYGINWAIRLVEDPEQNELGRPTYADFIKSKSKASEAYQSLKLRCPKILFMYHNF